MPAKFKPTSIGSISVHTPLALAGQRIGVMGGSFNPAHEGHVIVAETALRRLRLDRLWWLVTPGNPLKDTNELAPLEERMEGCRALVHDPRMVVTCFERDLATTFSAATLAFLKSRHPSVRFVWVMGADNLANFHRWRRWRDIADMMPLCVVDRPGWRLKALSSPAAHALRRSCVPEQLAATLPGRHCPAWSLLTARLSPASSTDLRQRGR